MIIERALNEQEQEISNKIAQLFYYSPSQNDDLPVEITQLLAKQDEESRQLLREVTINSLSYEQVRRREFIFSNLKNLINTEDKDEQALLIKAISVPEQLGEILNELGISASPESILTQAKNPELAEQIRLYNLIADRLTSFKLNIWEAQIKPIFDLLKKTDTNLIAELSSLIDKYYNDYSIAIDQETTAVIGAPNSLAAALGKVGLASILDGEKTLSQQLARLVVINVICKALMKERRDNSNMTDARLIKVSAALTLGLQDLFS